MTGQLEHSGRQNDEKMSRKIVNAQSCATFFRHFSAVLLDKLPPNLQYMQTLLKVRGPVAGTEKMCKSTNHEFLMAHHACMQFIHPTANQLQTNLCQFHFKF